VRRWPASAPPAVAAAKHAKPSNAQPLDTTLRFMRIVQGKGRMT